MADFKSASSACTVRSLLANYFIMLYLVEPKIDQIKDDGKCPIFLNLIRHGPIPIAIDCAYFRPPIRLAGHYLRQVYRPVNLNSGEGGRLEKRFGADQLF
jgi:hypothetical protein